MCDQILCHDWWHLQLPDIAAIGYILIIRNTDRRHPFAFLNLHIGKWLINLHHFRLDSAAAAFGML